MKRKLFLLLGSVFCISLVGGLFGASVDAYYYPSDEDKAYATELRTQLNGFIQDDTEDLWHYYFQLKVLLKQFNYEPQLNYLLSEMYRDLRTQINNKKAAAKFQSKEAKQVFLDNYIGGIRGEVVLDDRCVGRYNTIDDIGFTHDFPTALIIAYRYRESTCGYYLPKNGRGPFQITSHDYWIWEITDEVFTQSVVDFVKFSQAKIDRYEKANARSGLTIDLSYTSLNFTGVVRHWALYNSLSWNTVYWDIKPKRPEYVFDNYTYGSGIDASRNGVMTQFLRALEWELENKYDN